MCWAKSLTYDFSSCFFSKFKKSAKKGFLLGKTYFCDSYGPKIGGGGPPTRAFSQTIKNPGIRPISEYFVCSGVVQQNSAAHQCTCIV